MTDQNVTVADPGTGFITGGGWVTLPPSFNDPANENRMFGSFSAGFSFDTRPAGMWCRVVRVPTRAVYRKTVSCGRY